MVLRRRHRYPERATDGGVRLPGKSMTKHLVLSRRQGLRLCMVLVQRQRRAPGGREHGLHRFQDLHLATTEFRASRRAGEAHAASDPPSIVAEKHLGLERYADNVPEADKVVWRFAHAAEALTSAEDASWIVGKVTGVVGVKSDEAAIEIAPMPFLPAADVAARFHRSINLVDDHPVRRDDRHSGSQYGFLNSIVARQQASPPTRSEAAQAGMYTSRCSATIVLGATDPENPPKLEISGIHAGFDGTSRPQ